MAISPISISQVAFNDIRPLDPVVAAAPVATIARRPPLPLQ
jgi:hypothetical protein